MAELARFFGIIVRIFAESGERHHLPHVHVYYLNHKAVYGIDPIELIIGQLPRRQHRFVMAWMELYHEELLENWRLANSGQPVAKIPPLQRN